MWLTAARRADGCRGHVARRVFIDVHESRRRLRQNTVCRSGVGTRTCRCQERMAMRRYLVDSERDLFGTTSLGQDEPIALMNGNPTAQIRQRKRRLPVASVSRANE